MASSESVVSNATIVKQAHLTPAWCRLRCELWPDADPAGLDLIPWLEIDEKYVGFIASAPDGAEVGFAEASIRTDYVNGCEQSPAAFLEGLYVRPAYRKLGIARQLIATVTAWAATSGCRELASDVVQGNVTSLTVHQALGFTETERVVFFRKILT